MGVFINPIHTHTLLQGGSVDGTLGFRSVKALKTCFARNYPKSLREYVKSLGAIIYKRGHADRISQSFEQRKIHSINARFTKGKGLQEL